VSLILDALRRARQAAQPLRPDAAVPPAFRAQVPAALRFGAAGARERSGRGRRIVLTVVTIGIVVAIGTWGVMTLRRAAMPSRTARSASRNPADVRRASPGDARPADQAAARTAGIGEAGPVEPTARPAALNPASGRGTGASEAGPAKQVASAEAAVGARAPRAHVAAPPSEPRPLPATPPAALTTAAVSTTPAAPAVDHFTLAVRYQSLGNFEQALRHYTAALEADEFNVEARNNLGLLYRDHGLLNEAIDQFRRAVSINPQYLKARSNLAVALTDAGRLAEANAELRAALAIEPRNVDLLVNLALVQKADHMPDAALETLVRALGYDPKHAVAHYNLALLYEEKGERAAAYDHYLAFLQNAGPELGGLLSDVQRRADALRKQLDIAKQ
jgi:Tfp pilus assembly protein PilF